MVMTYLQIPLALSAGMYLLDQAASGLRPSRSPLGRRAAPQTPCKCWNVSARSDCERALPLALPAGWASCPPDPLQMMLSSDVMHRRMPTVCQNLHRLLPAQHSP